MKHSTRWRRWLCRTFGHQWHHYPVMNSTWRRCLRCNVGEMVNLVLRPHELPDLRGIVFDPIGPRAVMEASLWQRERFECDV